MSKLIITADDFGYKKLYNKMILELIEEGAVTSTSVMVDEIDADQKEQIERLARLSEAGQVSAGLHIYFKNENFEEEIKRQFEKFVSIFGFEPSHLDIHKIDYAEEGYPVIQDFCKQKNIPCKNIGMFDKNIMSMEGLITTKDSIFDATTNPWSAIVEWLRSLDEDIYCINFHPGYYDPESTSTFNKEREVDAEHVRKILNNLDKFKIELVNFNDLKIYFQL